jgi:hypothetical protein
VSDAKKAKGTPIALCSERAAHFPVERRVPGTTLERCSKCGALLVVSPASLALVQKVARGAPIQFLCRLWCMPRLGDILQPSPEMVKEAVDACGGDEPGVLKAVKALTGRPWTPPGEES